MGDYLEPINKNICDQYYNCLFFIEIYFIDKIITVIIM
jgi:hypothetical protein